MPMPRHRRHVRAAFTLVETMVVGGILMSIALVLTLWLNGVSDLWWTSTTFSYSRTSAQLAVNRMVVELRSTTRTAIGTTPVSVAAGNQSMTFYLPAVGVINATGDLAWDPTQIVYTYVPAVGQLQRIRNGQMTVLANKVTNVRFDDIGTDASLGADELRVQLTQQMRTPGGRTLPANVVNEIVRLRN